MRHNNSFFDQITPSVLALLALPATQTTISTTVAAYLADPTNTTFSDIHTAVNEQIYILQMQSFFPNFREGANPFVIVDESGMSPTGFRNATEDDLILLTAAAVAARGPLGDGVVLTPDEQQEISDIIDQFNSIIKERTDANSDRIAFLDIYTLFNDIAISNGVPTPEKVQTQYGTIIDASISPPFGIFSLDGIHPNARGYAFTANLMIDAINKKFNANIPLVDINTHPVNDFPPQ